MEKINIYQYLRLRLHAPKFNLKLKARLPRAPPTRRSPLGFPGFQALLESLGEVH